MSTGFLQLERYEPPAWTQGLAQAPLQRCRLGMFPTPIHRWQLPGLPPDVEMWIKRDDMTGMQLSGNKVRKLEFLMAEALRGGHDCVVTIGGVQSNHCRATAVAARYLGLDCHLILRLSRSQVEEDPGLVGNLLLDRLAGAIVHKVTKEEYVAKGSEALGRQLVAELQAAGRWPYLIPVGGSNPLGTWGYLEAVEELRQQQQHLLSRAGSSSSSGGGQPGAGSAVTAAGGSERATFFTDVAMACGSGGTSAGLALGLHLSQPSTRVHAYAVCDDPSYFHTYIDGLLAGLYAPPPSAAPGGAQGASVEGQGPQQGVPKARDIVRVVQSKGQGYALSSEQELKTVVDVARATGVVLDPVYSGKAVHAMLHEMHAAPAEWSGRRVLFVHTGGLMGMYDKVDQLSVLLVAEEPGRVRRMRVV